MQRFIRLPTAKEVWEAVSKTFYNGSDETRLFELNHKSFSIRQDGRPLSTYFSELMSIFQEIDHRSTFEESTVDGVVELHSAMARLRVHIFLSGLDSEFDQVRGEVLRKDPKLDLESTYAYVRRDFQQRQTMGGSTSVAEHAALTMHPARQGGTTRSTRNRRTQQARKPNNFTCDHCGEDGHSKQRCYELIGYLNWCDFSKKLRKKVVGKALATVEDESGEERDQNPRPSTHIAHTSSIGKGHAFSITSRMNTWIIDTGASDHMIGDSTKLNSLNSSSQTIVSTANGSECLVVGE